MGKVSREQWLGALRETRLKWKRILALAEVKEWYLAHRQAREQCPLCLLVSGGRPGYWGPCEACVWQRGLGEGCVVTLDPIFSSIRAHRLNHLKRRLLPLEAAYKKVRRWVREHYDG